LPRKENMTDKNVASQEDNATTKETDVSQTTNTEDSGSGKENPEESQDTKVETTDSDYFGEKKEEETEVDYKKRYSDSTRQYQILKEEAELSASQLKRLEKLAQKNPKIFEEIKRAQENASEGQPIDSTLIQREIERQIKPIKEGYQKDRQAEKFKVLNSFAKKNPKLFPPKATREIREKMGKDIMDVADVLAKKGMDYSKAVKRAALSVNPQAARQQGKDEAYLEMVSTDQASFSSQVSDEGKRTKKVRHSAKALEAAKAMGVKLD